MSADRLTLVVLLAALVTWLFAIAVSRPRLVLYAIFALSPTQFIFIPVSTFFISPADVLVLVAGMAFAARLGAGSRAARISIWKHRYLFLMICAYLVGFLVLDIFSRTLVRVPMAIVPSVLAYEVLRTRSHLARAATALVCAGVLDAAYGLGFYVLGAPLYPGRFSGMSGVNFSAIVILT